MTQSYIDDKKTMHINFAPTDKKCKYANFHELFCKKSSLIDKKY